MLLRVSNVGWRIGAVRILQNVSLAVAPGEFVALMGRNGAGKSTLLDLIAGLQTPSEGVIAIDDRPLAAWSPHDLSQRISHLPQIVRADAAFTTEQLVLMGRYPHSTAWRESREDRLAAERAMTRCDCLAFRTRRVSTLSGGERQRVLLASCLAQGAQLLLLDEPATFLDIEQQLQCFTMLRQETSRGAACLAVTHDLNLALTFCTRLVVMAEGTLAADVATDSAIENPAWLQLFSTRLVVTRTPAGRAWVCYA